MSGGVASGAQVQWVERVLGVDVGASTPPGSGGSTVPGSRGLAGWRAARTAAINTLKELEAAIRDMDVPERDEAVILVRAIQANLTAEPSTPQQVAELQRYIESDDIFAEAEDPTGFGIKVELRVPLLAALDGLRAETAAAERATGTGGARAR